MSFQLTVIGSGSAIPTLERGASAQYIHFNKRHILIDCGEGTQVQLRKFNVKFQRIDTILISHLHGDHYFGLMGLLVSMDLLGRTRPMTLYGPPELKELIAFQLKTTGIRFHFQLDIIPLTATSKTVIDEDLHLAISAFPVRHRIPCWGFHLQEKRRFKKIAPDCLATHQLTREEIHRVREGKDILRGGLLLKNETLTLPSAPPVAYAYSADTRYFDEMVSAVEGVDLLYHEATFTEKYRENAEKTMHSTAKEAATIAQRAGVNRLLLGHFSKRFKQTDELLAEAQAVFKNTVCINDGDTFSL